MPERTADWHLLQHDRDPVPNDASELDDAIRYYAEVAEVLTTQAKLAERIGSGDTSALKGKYADAIRDRAQKTADHLGKAANRYRHMHEAIKAYQPDLELARSETWAAVTEASDADAAQRRANGMPDPASATRPPSDPPPTDGEKQQSQARTRAVTQAGDQLAAAQARAQRAMETFRAAAERTAAAIRKPWADDGLHASGWDKFVFKLNKFLKGLVKALAWIGVALAVIGLAITGVGFVALAGFVVAAIDLVVNIILAAQGEASWVGVALGIVSILTLGAGALVLSRLATRKSTVIGEGRAAIRSDRAARIREQNRLEQRLNVNSTNRQQLESDRQALASGQAGTHRRGHSMDDRERLIRNDRADIDHDQGNLRMRGLRVGEIERLLDRVATLKEWWQVRPVSPYLSANLERIKDAWPWRWDRALGIDGPRDLNKLTRMLEGVPGFDRSRPPASTWTYAGAVAVTWGWGVAVFGAVMAQRDQR